MQSLIHASVTRIASFEGAAVAPLPREDWRWADYVVGRVASSSGGNAWVELGTGRMIQVSRDDQILGALGTRRATLQVTGTWEDVAGNGRMHMLSASGLMGKLTSRSPFADPPLRIQYLGHLVREGRALNMQDFACLEGRRAFHTPVLLIIGSSMSAGKTNAARIAIRRLVHMGLRVLAAKLTGAGRYRDILTMGDVGADAIFDFVDAGLPSSVCPPDIYRQATGRLLSRMAEVDADIAVIEAGASPLEPYNGDAVMDLLRAHIRMILLCALDPYAVLGMTEAFGSRPDLVSGVACNTDAGRTLIQRLTGLPALELTDPASLPTLDAMLQERFFADRRKRGADPTHA